MAKPSKVQDYWRDHNLENLLKELTQILVRRMPSDPVIAIVEHLQKKFPKSFKTSPDTNGISSKVQLNSSQLHSITSPRSDIQNESINDIQIGRRLSNQSATSGIVTIPTMGSAFTDLLKQDTSSARQAPEVNIRNLVFANRLSQQAVKLGKNIRSDRDILEEEVIRPTKTKSTISTTENLSVNSATADIQDVQTHGEPTVKQIIKYKQDIRTENDRRIHREGLANLARQQREKEQFFQSDLSTKPEDIQQQKIDDDDDESSSQVVPKEINEKKSSRKPVANSKEEEEILNDENVFRPGKQRNRGRQRNKSSTTNLRERPTLDSRLKMARVDGNLVCKVCGHVLTGEENQTMLDTQLNSAAPTARSFEPHQSLQSTETSSAAIVDDWFETGSNATNSRQISPRPPDDTFPIPIGSSTFRQNLFQPINDHNTDTIQHQSPVRSSIIFDDETKTKRLTSPRLSETNIFTRMPESKIRRPSSSRSIPSPVTKKHQPNPPIAVTNHQLINTRVQPSPPRLNPTPTLTTTLPSTTDRRMSGWSVREHSPDDSDDN